MFRIKPKCQTSSHGKSFTVICTADIIIEIVAIYILLMLFVFSMASCGNDNTPYIVLFKMFSRWFFANKKFVITFRTSKFGDVR